MKLFAAPKYLSDGVVPLVTLNYLVGLRIFEYPRGKLRKMPSLIYLLFLLGIFCVSIHKQYIVYKKIPLLKLERVLNDIMVYVSALITAYEMVYGYLYTKTVNACYRKFAQIDETLRQLGSTFNYRGIYLLSIGAVIVWFLYVVCTGIVRGGEIVDFESDLLPMIWIIISEILITSIRLIIIFEFSIFARYLQTRFKLINKLLKESVAVSTTEGIKLNLSATEDHAKIMDSEQRKNIFSRNMLFQFNGQLQSRIQISMLRKRNLIRSRSCLPFQLQNQFQMELQGQSRNQISDSNSVQRLIMFEECRRRIHLLQSIRQVHLELCRVLKMLCISFGIPIILKIGYSIVYTTVFFYYSYMWQTTKHNLIDKLFGEAIFTSSYVLVIILINFVCKHATDEGKKTNAIIHEIYGCCSNTDIREEIQQFGLQTTLGSVEFFTFGVFLDYRFLSSCLKTVVTYLVITIQVSNSLESNKNS